ncbi:MAG: oligosaccharide flippase family protein [Flavobacteriales bacterium]
MQKRFFSSLALSLFLNLLIKPISVLVVDAGVQRVLGNEVYGQYFVLLTLTLVFNIFLDLGINNFTTRYIAQEETQINQHVSRVFYLRLIMFLCYAVLVFAAAWLINIPHNQYLLLTFLVLNQFFIQSIAFIRSLFAGLHLFNTDTFISVLDRALLILIMGSGLLFSIPSITINNFVIAQTVCYFGTFMLAAWLIRNQLKWIIPVFDPAYMMSILKRSAPFALLVLLMLLYNRSDVVLLKQLAAEGNYQAGIYAQGYRLLDAFYMLGMIFASLLFPVFSRMIHQRSQELSELLQISGKLLIGGAIGIMFVSIYNAPFLLHLIYGDTVDAHSITVFVYLMIAFLAMSFNFIFGTLLTAGGYLRALNLSALVGVIVSVGFNIYLIPKYGAEGAAIAAIATQSVVSILLVIISAKKLRMHFSVKSLFAFIGFGGLLFSIKTLSNIGNTLFQTLLFDVIMVGVFAFLFSIIDLKSLGKIFNFKEGPQ